MTFYSRLFRTPSRSRCARGVERLSPGGKVSSRSVFGLVSHKEKSTFDVDHVGGTHTRLSVVPRVVSPLDVYGDGSLRPSGVGSRRPTSVLKS